MTRWSRYVGGFVASRAARAFRGTSASRTAEAPRRRAALVAVGAMLALCVVVSVAGSVGAGGLGGDRTLVVTHENGTELVADSVDGDTEVVIEYTHSVEKTTVRDVYVPTADGLRMTRTEFSSFGAGLPSRADVTERDGHYVHRPDREAYPTLHLKTGELAGHDLIVGGARYDLSGTSGGGAVEITVERRGPLGG